MALRLSGLRGCGLWSGFVGLIRRSRHQALRRRVMCGLFAGWRYAYPAYAVSATWFPWPDKARFPRTDKAKPPSGIASEGDVRAVCRMALRLSGLRRFSNMGFPCLIRRSFVGLIRRSRHQAGALMAAEGINDERRWLRFRFSHLSAGGPLRHRSAPGRRRYSR